ncbi:F-box protein At5g50450-like [Tasmannia lanceolata]|uniref:F-box protein At5g50450-like n=1 Tax=Tasmannia lanceolata TaxID=3420 RepID=UPI0040640A7F
MGRCKKMKRKHQNSISSIKSLPTDLVVEIMGLVASSSISNLINMKLACKEFHEASGDNRIFRWVSMESLPTVMWDLSSKTAIFVKRCEENGNPDALYKIGMIQYFSSNNTELGRDLLKKAADSGNLGAIYTLWIIQFSDPSSEMEGMELLNKFKSERIGIEKCRGATKKLLREIWIKNTLRQRRESRWSYELNVFVDMLLGVNLAM